MLRWCLADPPSDPTVESSDAFPSAVILADAWPSVIGQAPRTEIDEGYNPVRGYSHTNRFVQQEMQRGQRS